MVAAFEAVSIQSSAAISRFVLDETKISWIPKAVVIHPAIHLIGSLCVFRKLTAVIMIKIPYFLLM
jgi:hypothetical protein